MTRKKNPFKVGDKVRCIEPADGMPKPDRSGIYTIASVYGEYVGLDELSLEWLSSRFSLVERKKEEKTMTTYNPGEKVWIEFTVHEENEPRCSSTVLVNLPEPKVNQYKSGAVEISTDRIRKHIPAPKSIVVGSKVTRRGFVHIGTVLGINENDVWVRWTPNFSSVSSKGGLKLLDD